MSRCSLAAQRALILLAFSCFSVVSAAETTEQRQLLDAISAQMVISERIAGDFTQRKYIRVLPQPLRSEGTFSFDRKAGLEWRVTAPLQSRLVFDGEGMHQEQGGKRVWEASDAQPAIATLGRVMRAVLSVDWPVLEDYFFITGSRDNEQWSLALEPKQALLKNMVENIALGGGRHLQTMTLYEASGDRTEVIFRVREP